VSVDYSQWIPNVGSGQGTLRATAWPLLERVRLARVALLDAERAAKYLATSGYTSSQKLCPRDGSDEVARFAMLCHSWGGGVPVVYRHKVWGGRFVGQYVSAIVEEVSKNKKYVLMVWPADIGQDHRIVIARGWYRVSDGKPKGARGSGVAGLDVGTLGAAVRHFLGEMDI